MTEEMEPKEYFEELKGQGKTMDTETLKKNLEAIDNIIESSFSLGQDKLLHRLVFTREIIEKEQTALVCGYDTYVYSEDVLKFIEKVTPKNSVKIIELENFPRVIPEKNAADIVTAKNWNLFDRFYVVFTDFTNNDYRTPEQKATIIRNRDPIVFGAFNIVKDSTVYDRLYFITDWEDEFCDLTFTKMINRMAEMGMKKIDKKISTSPDYLNEIIKGVKEKAAESNKDEDFKDSITIVENKTPEKKEKLSIFGNLWKKLKG